MPLGPRLSLLAFASLALLSQGCTLLLPEVTSQTVTHNPFPQLSRVAVLPFFNQSQEPTLDGRVFAEAYFAALQETRGFEVVPVGVAANVARELRTDLANASSRRQLANALGVDAIVIGSVTDYTPYYPPRCAMRVDWYAANAGFHAIPVGYGLPWGTPAEEFIPGDVVFDAEMELARAQLATQSPLVAQAGGGFGSAEALPAPRAGGEPEPLEIVPEDALPIDPFEGSEAGESLPPPPEARQAAHAIALDGAGGAAATNGNAPAGWPDARGFTPPGPAPARPLAQPHNGPVISHTRLFRGSDAEFTAALAGYFGFQDDARLGGWESYLDRSDDFIRFCCHLHLQETLVARGGGGETRVVRRWSNDR